MHNKTAIGARPSQSLWHQSIASLRQGMAQPNTNPSLPTGPDRATVAGSATDASGSLLHASADASLPSSVLPGDVRGDLRESLCAVATFSSVLRQMDAQTHNHSERVARNALQLAKRVGVATEEFHILQLGALLHDCGKIGVSTQILNKPGALNEHEYSEIKKHPMHGVAIIDSVPLLRGAIPTVRHHHERFDGRGYPDGLRGESIPITARIVGLVDAFDAIISDRPYRRGVSPKDARGILCQNSGTQFDPELVEAFVSDSAMTI
jgi:HD-GYP domain-containing protein (c-di-GMP phosphodiesterase class II)